MTVYTVKSGDTLSGIARRFGVSLGRLVSDNGLTRPGALVPGQALVILDPEIIHTVRRGDTLFSIARSYGTTVSALLRNNPELTNARRLIPAQTITVFFTERPTEAARINGYAYPFISPELLRRELPFLSTLTVFGYGFREDGKLIIPDDEPLIAAAREFGVAPVLLLSSVTEEGGFSSKRASLLFNDITLQNTVLDELGEIMQSKGYRGLDIDFEYVNEEDTEAFISFIANASGKMHALGYFVNVDLAPKASADQRGLLYEAHDYGRIGALADTVLLMTYEWGYTYGPPMAVAPLNQVERIVQYAVSEIPPDKIMLGVPNYGYDWALPFEKGQTKARSISNQEAVSIASDNRADILFDETAKSPCFYYTRDSVAHEVWFEDARSINAKLELAEKYGLLGYGYWNLQRPFNQNWALLSVKTVPLDI